jgi:hypothetical protein
MVVGFSTTCAISDYHHCGDGREPIGILMVWFMVFDATFNNILVI